MLCRQLLGDELFYYVIHEWTSRYARGNVSTEDFINLVNELSGEDYRWFFDQWIYNMGHPELVIHTNIFWNPESEFGEILVAVQQVQDNAPLFRFPLIVEGTNEIGTTQQTLWFDAVDTWQVQYATYWHIAAGGLADNQPLLYEDVTQSVPRGNPQVPSSVDL